MWQDNIRIDLREIGWCGMDWIDLAQDRDQWRALATTVMTLQVPYIVGIFLSRRVTGGFSRHIQLHGVSYCHLSRAGLKINIECDIRRSGCLL
jgi:hypothetical protein